MCVILIAINQNTPRTGKDDEWISVAHGGSLCPHMCPDDPTLALFNNLLCVSHLDHDVCVSVLADPPPKVQKVCPLSPFSLLPLSVSSCALIKRSEGILIPLCVALLCGVRKQRNTRSLGRSRSPLEKRQRLRLRRKDRNRNVLSSKEFDVVCLMFCGVEDKERDEKRRDEKRDDAISGHLKLFSEHLAPKVDGNKANQTFCDAKSHDRHIL